MEEQKQTFNWVRLLIVLALVVFAAVAVGGTTYYVLNSNFQKEREANEKALNDVLDQTKEDKKKNTPAPTSNNTTTTTGTATTAATPVDPTANWESYTNQDYAFSVKYPNTHYVDVKGGTPFNLVVFLNKYRGTSQGVSGAVGMTVYKTRGDLKGWIEQNPDLGYLAGSVSNMTVGGRAGYSFKSNGMGGVNINYAVSRNNGDGFNYFYVISGLESGSELNVLNFANTLNIN